MQILQKTALYEAHIQLNGKIVDFSGWALPLHYGSQLKEHQAVRKDAGMFDVSHMLVTEVEGKEAKCWLERLLANDINKLTIVGKALYSAMLNKQGGVMDDLIVYRLNAEESHYRIISNAATRDKDLKHFQETAAGLALRLTPRDDTVMIAIQGPKAIEKLSSLYPEWKCKIESLQPFQGTWLKADHFIAKTGYTGEDGVELVIPAQGSVELFLRLYQAGITPCGLGARDTLRLEAGMNLYGHEMDEDTSPLEAGMAWTVVLDDQRDFIGKAALLRQKEKGLTQKLVGVILETAGVLRDGMKVTLPEPDRGEGFITSGSFSPILKCSIGFARVPIAAKERLIVNLRGKSTPLRIVRVPFVRHGKKQFN